MNVCKKRENGEKKRTGRKKDGFNLAASLVAVHAQGQPSNTAKKKFCNQLAAWSSHKM
jgi:hypothetical protein